jgi:hypothetical protein
MTQPPSPPPIDAGAVRTLLEDPEKLHALGVQILGMVVPVLPEHVGCVLVFYPLRSDSGMDASFFSDIPLAALPLILRSLADGIESKAREGGGGSPA